MKRLIYCLFILAAIAAPLSAFADVWTVGEVRTGYIVYCKDAKDAQEIAVAYVKGGESAADAVLTPKIAPVVGPGNCASRPASFVIVKLVSTHKGEKETMNVVEVKDAAGSGTYYVVNSTQVVRDVGGDPKTRQNS